MAHIIMQPPIFGGYDTSDISQPIKTYQMNDMWGGTEGNEDPGGVQGVLNWKIAKKPVRLAMTRLLQSKPGFDNFYQDFCLDFQAIL
jgi:hypothetical protein